jgi:hypothetical protein
MVIRRKAGDGKKGPIFVKLVQSNQGDSMQLALDDSKIGRGLISVKFEVEFGA